jgi:hypothetical protein
MSIEKKKVYKKYNYVFIIRTPYHYINALEAVNKYEIETKKSILVIWRNHIKERFDHIVCKKKWGELIYLPVVHHEKNIPYISRAKNLYEDASYLIKTNYILSNIRSIDICFSIPPTEKYLQHIINKVKSKKLIVIDEGVGTFRLIERYLEKRRKEFSNKFFRYDRRRNESYEFFTSYPLNEYIEEVNKKDIIKHSFEFLKSKYDIKKGKKKNGLILGTEHNKNNKDIYDDFVSKSIGIAKRYVDKVWYKPHRMETKKQVKNITKGRCLELIENDLPIEMALLENSIVPHFVIGFASTAIHSIKKIYKKNVKEAVVFTGKNIDKKDRLFHDYYKSLPDVKIDMRYS